MDNPWDKKPDLEHLRGDIREAMEERRRHRKVRYMLFRLQTAALTGRPLESVDGLLPGFIDFWLLEKPAYQIGPKGDRQLVDPAKLKMVKDIGGYKYFAHRWDVDAELLVYLRHSSVWQEWNATLQRVVPVFGEM